MAQKSDMITATEVIESYAVHGDDMVQIANSGKTNAAGQSEYFVNKFITKDNKSKSLRLKYYKMPIGGCPSPEERIKRKNVGPSFSFKIDAVDEKGEEVGRACELIEKAWMAQCRKKIEADGEEQSIVSFISRTRVVKTPAGVGKKATSTTVPMDPPLIRIKFRSKSKAEANKLKGAIHVMNSEDPQYRNPDFINPDNLHVVIRGGSTAQGFLDFTTTIRSEKGYSNTAANDGMMVWTRTSRDLDILGEFGEEDESSIAPREDTTIELGNRLQALINSEE